jgi:hypothetical protein
MGKAVLSLITKRDGEAQIAIKERSYVPTKLR